MKETSETKPSKQRKELETLRLEIEEAAGIPSTTPEDRSALWECINERLEVEYKKEKAPLSSLSESTLERLWKIGNYKEGHYRTTYDALAVVAGYKNWRDFVASLAKEKRAPVFYPDSVESSRLKPGEEVTIGWPRIYYIKARYLGDDRFEVLRAKGPKRKKGSVFCAKWFSVAYVRVSDEQRGEGYLYAPQIWLHQNEKPQGGSDVEGMCYYDTDM